MVQTANALPVVTICQLLLANLGAVPAISVGSVLSARDGYLSRILPLAMRLAECLHQAQARRADGPVESQDDEVWQGVLFFLDFLGDENEHTARTAVAALGLVLACLENVKRVAKESEALLGGDGMLEDAGNGGEEEEEELLAGGGGEVLLAAGGGGEEEILLGGGGPLTEGAEGGQLANGAADTDPALPERSIDDGAGAGSVVWLQRLVGLESVPATVSEKLVVRLRGALRTETEVEVLLQYLEYLRFAKRVLRHPEKCPALPSNKTY